MTPSIQQVLVHLDPSVASSERLALARRVARQHGASLSALYATTPVMAGLTYAPELAPTMAATVIEIDDERRARTRRMFDESMRTGDVVADWSETLEVPVVGAFVGQALYSDLLVLGQRNPDDVLGASVPPDFPELVIAASGRPALVVPYIGCPAQVGETVVIAWKESREAARALAAALPILKMAHQVHVVTWQGEARYEIKGSPLDLDSYLGVHGVTAKWHRGGPEPQEVGEMLLSSVAELGADLLVMGCYGHSRAREWILGGASRTVLGAMTVPVLMAH